LKLNNPVRFNARRAAGAALAAAVLFFAFNVPRAGALDFGGIVNERFESSGTAGAAGEAALRSVTMLAPWLSIPWDTGEFYLSAGASADWQRDGERVLYVPELFRLEAAFRPASSLTVRAGRILWDDPSRWTMTGAFDGVDVFAGVGSFTLGGGVYYTGLLYRDTANVKGTPGDPVDYALALDWGDFTNTYFSPRRVLAVLHGEFPGFPAGRGTLRAAVLGQFDVSAAPQRLNSQYLLLRYSLELPWGFDVQAAGAASLIEWQGNVRGAFAGSLDAGWMLPGALPDRLSLVFRGASGEGGTAPYFPVTAAAQGIVLEPELSGIMTLRGGYEARLLSSLSAEAGFRYFVRTDVVTFVDADLDGDSRFLGGEVSASLRWVPFSDLSFAVNGGVFFPQMGMAFRDGAPVRWLVSAGVIVSF
jgi:hypothetical protein